MATSLRLNWDEGSTLISHINENCADGVLAQFAGRVAELSTYTLRSIDKVVDEDILNAGPEPEPTPTGTYALWTPSAEFYDINNDVFKQVMCNEGRTNNASTVSTIDNIYVVDNGGYDGIAVDFTRRNGSTDTTEFNLLSLIGDVEYFMSSSTGRPMGFGVEGDWDVVADEIGLTVADVITKIRTNKLIEVVALYINNHIETMITSSRLRRVNVSYVQSSNSILVQPVEGIEEQWYVGFNNAKQFYIPDSTTGEASEDLDPAYYDGRVLGHNTTFAVEGKQLDDFYIKVGID